MGNSPHSHDEDLADFITYLASEKGMTVNTIEAYGRDLRALIKYLKSQGINTSPEVTATHLIGFLSSLKAAQYATSSICRSLVAIKVFFQFMKREELIKENISLYLETPKLWKTIPAVLSISEIETLLKEPNLNTHAGIRDLAILELLYSSGLRVSELCNLSIYSIDDQYVRVFGKGRKERIVPLGKKALEAVDNYLLHVRCLHDSKSQQLLFLTSKGKSMNRIAVWKMVKKYAKYAGIVKTISPHTFRHSFATHLLDNGADLRVIQEMLGHSNISSTDRYTHISNKKLQDDFQRFHRRY